MIRNALLCCLVLSGALLAQAPAPQGTPTPAPEPTLMKRPSLRDADVGASQGMSQEEIAAARTMVTRIDNWSPRLNAPAGVSLELRELSRKTDGDKTVISYALYGTNIPKDKIYRLGRWPIDEPERTVLTGLGFDDQGRAICPGTTPGACGDPKKPNLPLVLPVSAASMEPIRFAIVSEDKTVRAFTAAVPFPNLAKDGKCSIQAVLGVPDRELMMIEGSGFTPAEPLKVHQSDPPRDQEIRADADGTVSVAVLHPVAANNSGTVSVKVAGASCAPEVTYEWGPNLYKKVKAGLE